MWRGGREPECEAFLTSNEPDYDHLVHECVGVPHAGRDSLPGLEQESQSLGQSILLSFGNSDGGLDVL